VVNLFSTPQTQIVEQSGLSREYKEVANDNIAGGKMATLDDEGPERDDALLDRHVATQQRSESLDHLGQQVVRG